MSLHFNDTHNKIFNSNKKLTIIKAVAGSGKTTTMLELARRYPSRKYIYITYNNASAKDIKSKASNNVFPSTFHSIAARVYLDKYRHKLKSNISVKDVLKIANLKTDRSNVQLARVVIESINLFQNSKAMRIQDSIVRSKHIDRESIIIYTDLVWNFMIDESSSMPCTHDTYLKLFHLNGCTIDGMNIIFDEAQDASDVMIDILRNQIVKNDTNVFVVGDENQSIYQFRYSNKAMEAFQSLNVDKNIYHLNESYRFGSEISKVANLILKHKGFNVNIVGLGGKDLLVRKIGTGKKMAIIARSNETVLEMAIKSVDAGKTVCFIGGFDSYNISDVVDLENLFLGRRGKIASQDVLEYRSFAEFEKMAMEIGDSNSLRLINIVKSYAGKIESKIKQIKSSTVSEERADVVLTNAHKSKGLEFDNVFLCNDFRCYYDNKGRKLAPNKDFEEELNLLYVATTRARKTLRVNKSIEQMINNYQS